MPGTPRGAAVFGALDRETLGRNSGGKFGERPCKAFKNHGGSCEKALFFIEKERKIIIISNRRIAKGEEVRYEVSKAFRIEIKFQFIPFL